MVGTIVVKWISIGLLQTLMLSICYYFVSNLKSFIVRITVIRGSIVTMKFTLLEKLKFLIDVKFRLDEQPNIK